MSLAVDKRGRLVAERPHKYGVAPKHERTVDGVTFASKKEATRYRELKLMEKCGAIQNLELQPWYGFPMGFAYVGDFRYVQFAHVVVEDVKGVITPIFRLKQKCMAHFYPAVELRIV